jgi:hypothetical protein
MSLQKVGTPLVRAHSPPPLPMINNKRAKPAGGAATVCARAAVGANTNFFFFV